MTDDEINDKYKLAVMCGDIGRADILRELQTTRAALERARALVAEQATIITANVWHIPPEYSARNIIMDVAIKLRELAAALAEGGRP